MPPAPLKETLLGNIYSLLVYWDKALVHKNGQTTTNMQQCQYCYTVCLTILVHARNEWTGQGIQETMYVFLTWRQTIMQTAAFMCIMWPTNVVAM